LLAVVQIDYVQDPNARILGTFSGTLECREVIGASRPTRAQLRHRAPIRRRVYHPRWHSGGHFANAVAPVGVDDKTNRRRS
jgi:hypothetical protein